MFACARKEEDSAKKKMPTIKKNNRKIPFCEELFMWNM
jgi:hypothetical protein